MVLVTKEKKIHSKFNSNERMYYGVAICNPSPYVSIDTLMNGNLETLSKRSHNRYINQI